MIKPVKLTKQEQYFYLLDYQSTGSDKSMEMLVRSYYLYIVSIAHKYPPSFYDDAIGVGILTLIQAIENFDLSKKGNSLSYLMICIKGAIVKEYYRLSQSASMPEKLHKLKRLQWDDPHITDAELMKELGMKQLNTLKKLKLSDQPTLFLDAFDHDGVSNANRVGAVSAERYFDEEVENAFESIEERLDQIPPLERRIIRDHFGFKTDGKLVNYSVLSRKFGVSIYQIRSVIRRFVEASREALA